MKKSSSLKKKAQAAVIVTSTTASLITHSVVEDPKELLKKNNPVFDRVVEGKLSLSQRIAKKLYNLPTIVKILLVLPMWALGYALSLLIEWIATPLIIKWLAIAIIALVIIVLILHLIFPEKSLKELLEPKNIILTFIGIGILGLGLDYYQHQFPEYYKAFKYLLEFTGTTLVILIVVCNYFRKNRRVLFLQEE